MDIGHVLHEARERRGLTLNQISGTTKISVAMLEHIERNEFDQLPGSVFTKGYLHAFASTVGVEDRPLMQEFDLLSKPPISARPAPTFHHQPVEAKPTFRFVMPLLALLAAAAAAYLVVAMSRGSTTAPAVADVATVETAPTPAAAPVAAPQAPSFPVTLALQFTGDCWVSATADGENVVYRLIRAGERVSVSASRELVLRVGDPTVVTYTINGTQGPPLGRPGAPATVQLNQETLASLLQTR